MANSAICTRQSGSGDVILSVAPVPLRGSKLCGVSCREGKEKVMSRAPSILANVYATIGYAIHR